MIIRRFLIFAMIAVLSSMVWGARFTNQYCEFELPAGWQCSLEGSEWVCQSSNKDRKKEAIIILAAKMRGEMDDLQKYQAYLKQTKTFSLPGGKKQVSEAKYAKAKSVNKHPWIDALHLASEVPGFYTRYLATVKEDLGVAVTFSVSKDHYQSYQDVFDKVVSTLRVFRQKGADVGSFKLKKKSDDLLEDTTFIPDGMDATDISQRKRKGGGGLFGDDSNLIFIIIGGALVAFFIMKRKGGKKKKKKK